MSTSSTTLLYHNVPSAVRAVGALALAVNLNGSHKLATKSLLESPAGEVLKFNVPCSVITLYALKPALLSGVLVPSFNLKSPPSA